MRTGIVVMTVVLCLVTSIQLHAQDTVSIEDLFNRSEPTMRGLANDSVAVIPLTNLEYIFDFNRAVQLSERFASSVESRLRSKGVKVATGNLTAFNYPTVGVHVDLAPVGPGSRTTGYAFSVMISLYQDATLVRDTSIVTGRASTWQRSEVGYASADQMTQTVRAKLQSKVDEFLIEYLRVN